jgi:hypothetical protein
MSSIFKNDKLPYEKHVIIEKTNFGVAEITFLETLELDYGFRRKQYEQTLTKSQKILKSFGFYKKTKKFYCFDVYVSDINGNKFEVILDTWSVVLRKNEITIFDKARFENEDFYKLLI